LTIYFSRAIVIEGASRVGAWMSSFNPASTIAFAVAEPKAASLVLFCLNSGKFLNSDVIPEGLKKTKKVAIGKVAVRQRENLCVIRPLNGGLVLSTMYWSDELKETPQVPKAEVTPTQLELMSTVIGKFSKPFVHTDYTDKYNDALLEMAQKKLAGETIAVAVQQQPQRNLEDALRALVDKK